MSAAEVLTTRIHLHTMHTGRWPDSIDVTRAEMDELKAEAKHIARWISQQGEPGDIVKFSGVKLRVRCQDCEKWL